ncbi:hypothetical protein N656DRAFT_773995 [Canariomyces notabilis]|uniref:Uncharacterized protein n=1 Tax=Canariomyces notabilis TaxID=2074819 RepID=A0AAN6TNN7_9PEZI|nr:hypothetical protein N656DRAFT_773995 [Canariomyces arenarius]
MSDKGESISHNAVEIGHNIIHGAGQETSTRVGRADKTAPMPEYKRGAGLENIAASGGQSQGIASGPNKGQGGRGSTN